MLIGIVLFVRGGLSSLLERGQKTDD